MANIRAFQACDESSILSARTRGSIGDGKNVLTVFCYTIRIMEERDSTVLIDMDGVMVDFDKAALINIPEAERVARSSFYVADDYPDKEADLIKRVYDAPGFFESLEAMPGLLEAWQTLIDNGYKPRVASAPLSSNPTAVEGKIKWLDRIMVPEFGPGVVEDAIIDKNKWKYKGLALIDDRPDVPRGTNGADEAEWQHILFGWPHLEQVPMATAAFRLLSWHDNGTLLSTLETIASARQ